MSAFIVERAFSGFSSGTLESKWGILAGNTGFFRMEEVEVPEENRVGREGEGLQDRDVRARSGPLHRRRRRHRSDSRVPRRQCRVRHGSARTFGVEIGSASAGEGNDRAGWSPTIRRRASSGCAPAG